MMKLVNYGSKQIKPPTHHRPSTGFAVSTKKGIETAKKKKGELTEDKVRESDDITLDWMLCHIYDICNSSYIKCDG